VSGIVGILNLDGAPVDRELLERMTAFQSFRGPHRQDLWIDGPIGFGHTLARTTDESEREQQPCSLGGRLWITADARVDAREDLRGKLRDHTSTDLETATDPELLLHAYDAWGEECFQHLLGDFSFALWDAPRRRLVCAVDHFGVKPFYYARVGNAFVFSNTLDCVRMHPLVRDELNEVAIGDFLLFGHYQDRDITVYADIPRVPPAHYLVVKKGDVRRTRYWTLPEMPELRLKREEEYVERFQELLDKAVSDRLRTNLVGVFMSGGLDSPLVAATAKGALERIYLAFEMRAFTVVYDHLIPDDERYFSGLAGQAIGLSVQFRAADDIGVFDWLNRSDWYPPEPAHEHGWGWWVDLMRDIRSSAPITLTGWDGDALLRGTLRLHWLELVKQRRWARLTRDLAWYVMTQRGLPPIGFRTRLKGMFGGFARPSLPSWFEPGFARRVRLVDRWGQWTRQQTETSSRSATRNNVNSPLWTSLWDAHDPAWTGSDLEVRHPLADVRVVNFAIRLPAVPWCIRKELFRRCVDRLPLELRSRPKSPLQGDPVIAKLRQAGTGMFGREQLEPKLLRFVDERAVSAPDPYGGSEAVWAALRAMSLNYWLKGHIGGRKHAAGKAGACEETNAGVREEALRRAAPECSG